MALSGWPAASEWARLDTPDSSRRATRSRQPAGSVSLVARGVGSEKLLLPMSGLLMCSSEDSQKWTEEGSTLVSCTVGGLGRWGTPMQLALVETQQTLTGSMRVVVSQPWRVYFNHLQTPLEDRDPIECDDRSSISYSCLLRTQIASPPDGLV